MKEFDLEALTDFDGKDGKPVYLAHEGNVYDVTESKLWKNGLHMRRHNAGGDLTTDFQAAPHGTEVLARYPLVGVLKKAPAIDRKMPDKLSRLLKRYPFLNRHPHPMTVHFPIVFMMATTVFTLLYLATGVKSLETTAIHCLAAGILFIPVAILTGLFTWWHNYLAKPIKPVVVKLWMSLTMWVTAMVLFTWRMSMPGVLDSMRTSSFIYLVLTVALVPIISVIGWFGAKMTFPIEKD